MMRKFTLKKFVVCFTLLTLVAGGLLYTFHTVPIVKSDSEVLMGHINVYEADGQSLSCLRMDRFSDAQIEGISEILSRYSYRMIPTKLTVFQIQEGVELHLTVDGAPVHVTLADASYLYNSGGYFSYEIIDDVKLLAEMRNFLQ